MKQAYVPGTILENTILDQPHYPLQYSCLEDPTAWGHRRVGHDFVTKQQQQIHCTHNGGYTSNFKCSSSHISKSKKKTSEMDFNTVCAEVSMSLN